MPTVAQIERFATAHITDKSGRPFTLKGREWVREQFWRAVLGFKWWPIDPDRLCDECSRKANTLTEWTWDQPTAGVEFVGGEMHWTTDADHLSNAGCAGLRLHPVILTVLKLHRREGKTFNFGALANALGCILPHQQQTYLAVSEKQSDRLFSENFVHSVITDEDLAEVTHVVGNEIRYTETGSKFEFITSSAGSGTGMGRTLVGFDECRDLPQDVFTQVLPSVFAESGFECPQGHLHVAKGQDVPAQCPVCKSLIQPWFGRLVAMSSAGQLKGEGHDWFEELVEALQTEPDEGAHVYVSPKSSNPNVTRAATGVVERVLGRVESLKHSVDVEVHNIARAKGESFLAVADVKGAINLRLRNALGSELPAVGHLDCSLSNELTSLVIAVDVGLARGEEPWQWLQVARLDVWDPKNSDASAHAVPGGMIDEQLILPFFERTIPLFPGLRRLTVDTRGYAWPMRFVQRCSSQTWGRCVESLQRRSDERDTAFTELEERVRNKAGARGGWPPGKKAIELIDNTTMRKEFQAARKIRDVRGQITVREQSRKRRHLDVIDSVAMVCYLAFLEGLNRRRSLAEVDQAVRDSGPNSILNKLYARPKGGYSTDF